MTTSDKTVSQEKLNDFMLKVASDFGGHGIPVLINIGDKLGLYKEMSKPDYHFARTRKPNRNCRTLYKRMAGQSGCGRLRHLRLEHKELHFTSRTRTSSF